ncbi:uncharacterized protein LOC113850641 [Abrus precatorius]|uniref:Uncharacterized protein LOC113850641 n=1 Tax=Abrus precatorius TaxID=3816 RepID=A0A8B8K1Y2_ABRPR|nr:uncharacterized protein LOC113850641 [Abrus precatorius]
MEQQIERKDKRFAEIRDEMRTRSSKLESQLEQITSLLSQRALGALPSQPEPNPREQAKHALASPCTPMLTEKERSCFEQHAHADNEGTAVLVPSKVVLTEDTAMLDDEQGHACHSDTKKEIREDASVIPRMKVPFPQWLMSNQRDSQFNKFLGILRKLHTNIPFVEAISQMPKYAKFLKEMLSNKKKLEEF